MLNDWFYPNPGGATYASPKVIILFALCALLLVVSFAIGSWRKRQSNSITRRLSRSWARTLRIFALIGVVLIVSRVEQIQFFAMRALFGVWVLSFALYAAVQFWFWKKRHYKVLPKKKIEDERDRYLP